MAQIPERGGSGVGGHQVLDGLVGLARLLGRHDPAVLPILEEAQVHLHGEPTEQGRDARDAGQLLDIARVAPGIPIVHGTIRHHEDEAGKFEQGLGRGLVLHAEGKPFLFLFMAQLTPQADMALFFAEFGDVHPLARDSPAPVHKGKVMGVEVALERAHIIEGPIKARPRRAVNTVGELVEPMDGSRGRIAWAMKYPDQAVGFPGRQHLQFHAAGNAGVASLAGHAGTDTIGSETKAMPGALEIPVDDLALARLGAPMGAAIQRGPGLALGVAPENNLLSQPREPGGLTAQLSPLKHGIPLVGNHFRRSSAKAPRQGGRAQTRPPSKRRR